MGGALPLAMAWLLFSQLVERLGCKSLHLLLPAGTHESKGLSWLKSPEDEASQTKASLLNRYRSPSKANRLESISSSC